MAYKALEERLVGKEDDGFVYPHYDGYCLSNVPHTITALLGCKSNGKQLSKEVLAGADTDGIEKVVLLAVDGLGYDMWSDNADSGFLRAFKRRGSVVPITTVFPSTTAAAITTINTGLTPLQHGLLEWTLYLEEIGMTIHTLPFTALNKTRDQLHAKGIDPKILYRGRTVYQAMKREGISSATLQSKHLIGTAYNTLMQKGSEPMAYTSPIDMAIKLRKSLENPKGPSYINAYLEMVDSTTHAYGPYTEESREEISLLFHTLERLLLRRISRSTAKKTLLLITADHGHINTDPRKTTYLNKYRELAGYYALGKKGGRIPPTGGPRDVFLHIKNGSLDYAHEYLSEKLGKKARIMQLGEIMEKGLFGRGRPNRMFYKRLGNLLLLPYGNNTIWHEHIKGIKNRNIGHHGGMSRNEMLIPLAAAKLSDLL